MADNDREATQQNNSSVQDVINKKIVHSLSYDPWYNLALEEYLLQHLNPGEVILYLWQNDHTVVIGRNQNAWKECRCNQLEENGGKLARRLSGGGAVYHDLGNLNFTFLMDRNYYDQDKQLEIILKAVRDLGVKAKFSGRNDLIANGKKFSGNAFYFTAKTAYHHGTLLVDTDYNQLVDYLQVSKDKMKTKGVESVRSRVVNLKNINTNISIANLKSALQQRFDDHYNGDKCLLSEEYNPEEMSELLDLYKKYSAWEWRYGQTPAFDVKFKNRFSWGGIELGLSLFEGYIESVNVYSDAMDIGIINDLRSIIQGSPFIKEELIKKIDSLMYKEGKYQYKSLKYSRREIIKDIKSWLQEKEM